MKLSTIGGVIGFFLGGPAGARWGMSGSTIVGGFVDPGKPIPRSFGVAEIGPEIVVTVPGVLSINEARGLKNRVATRARGKCLSCGARDFIEHHGQMVCSYCRCAG